VIEIHGKKKEKKKKKKKGTEGVRRGDRVAEGSVLLTLSENRPRSQNNGKGKPKKKKKMKRRAAAAGYSALSERPTSEPQHRLDQREDRSGGEGKKGRKRGETDAQTVVKHRFSTS